MAYYLVNVEEKKVAESILYEKKYNSNRKSKENNCVIKNGEKIY
jgi:hypothetical protein